MERAIGLIRVSTVNQAEEGCSLSMQAEKIDGYCKLNDLELVDIIREEGISGRSSKREGLDRALEMITSGQVRHLVIFKLDRLSRSLRRALDVVDTLQRHNCELHSICERLDTSTATGRFFFTITSAIACWEAETIAERTTAALQSKRTRNERVGQVPYGLALSADGVNLIPEPTEQRVIRSILRYNKQGLSANAIACKLNERQIPTKNNGLWRNHTVKGILDREL
jgi:site-specific DNA recombinase